MKAAALAPARAPAALATLPSRPMAHLMLGAAGLLWAYPFHSLPRLAAMVFGGWYLLAAVRAVKPKWIAMLNQRTDLID